MADENKEGELQEEVDDLTNQLEDLQQQYDELGDELEMAREDYRSEHEKAEYLAKCLNEMRDIAVIGAHVRTVLDKYGY